MNNLREVKDDLLKEWIEYREETIFAITKICKATIGCT